jgi:hypothetical protein
MFKQDMHIHGSSPMVVFFCDHIFPLFVDITKTICLGNKMEFYTMHGLNNNRNHFTAIINHEKCQGKKKHVVKNPKLLI